MIKLKYGEGEPRDGHFITTLLPLEAELLPEHKDLTIQEIADQIAKQCEIKDGEIQFFHIQFKYTKKEDE